MIYLPPNFQYKKWTSARIRAENEAQLVRILVESVGLVLVGLVHGKKTLKGLEVGEQNAFVNETQEHISRHSFTTVYQEFAFTAAPDGHAYDV